MSLAFISPAERPKQRNDASYGSIQDAYRSATKISQIIAYFLWPQKEEKPMLCQHAGR